MELMPAKYVLDGSSKIQISYGARNDRASQYKQMLGASNYFVEDFNFLSYFQDDESDRERRLLSLIRKSLVDIASRCGADKAVIEDVADSVEKSEFRLRRKIKKLSRKVPDSPLKIAVYRNLSLADGESWSMEVLQKRDIVHKEVIGERPDYLDVVVAT
ncbi:MAG: hypothetical protein AB2598_10855 [Candidatus Thiodiazotropha sp.]